MSAVREIVDALGLPLKRGLSYAAARSMFTQLGNSARPGTRWNFAIIRAEHDSGTGLTNWAILNDVGHFPVNLSTPTLNVSGGILSLTQTVPASKVLGCCVVPDETFAKFGCTVGASHGDATVDIEMRFNRTYKFRIVGSASSGTGAYSATSNALNASAPHSIVTPSYDAASGNISLAFPNNFIDTQFVSLEPVRTSDSFVPESFLFPSLCTSSTSVLRLLNRGVGWYNGTANGNLQVNVHAPVLEAPNLRTFNASAIGGTPNIWVMTCTQTV